MTESRERRRASDHSWILKARENGTGQWLLALYRGGILGMMLMGTWLVAQAWGALDEVRALNLAPTLARIEYGLADTSRRLDTIERWIEGENSHRRDRSGS